jgi:hypothetical protein
VAGTLWALRSDNPVGEEGRIAERVRRTVASGDPDLTGGRRYLDTPRHQFYVTHGRYRKALQSFQRELAPR